MKRISEPPVGHQRSTLAAMTMASQVGCSCFDNFRGVVSDQEAEQIISDFVWTSVLSDILSETTIPADIAAKLISKLLLR